MNKMKTKKMLATILSLVLCLTMMIPAPIFAANENGTGKSNSNKHKAYAENEVVVCYVNSDDVDEEALKEELVDSEGSEQLELAEMVDSSKELMDLGEKSINKMRGIKKAIIKAKKARTGRVGRKLGHIKSKKYSTEELVEKLNELPNVEYAEPNYYREPQADTYYEYQWAYNGESDYGMNIPGWNDKSNTNGEDVVVAVMDTGVNYNNPDLAGVMWTGGNIPALTKLGGGKYGIYTAAERVYRGDSTNPMDENSHGTHCAGIIGAQWNDQGVSGAANGVKIMAVKAGKSSFYDTDLVEGLKYVKAAKEAGVNVVAVNNSWGSSVPGAESTSITDVIKELNDLGVICVFSAGNENCDTDIYYEDYTSEDYSGTFDGYWDAYYYHQLPNTIIVGGHGMSGDRAYYSNWGAQTVDVFAPGGDYTDYTGSQTKYVNYSTWYTGEILSTVSKGTSDYRYSDYGTMQGTSMAAPAVTGAVAILKSQHPDAKISDIKNALNNGIKEGNSDIKSMCTSGGYVDVEAALNKLDGNVEIQHYKQNIDDNNYELAETEKLNGEIGKEVTASPKAYEGFEQNTTTELAVNKGKVEDGKKLILKLYYDRITYDIKYVDEDGTELKKFENIRYGAKTPEYTPEDRAGKIFESWTPALAATVTGDATYTAKWKEATATLTYKYGSSTLKTVTMKYSDKVIADYVPTWSNYALNYWSTNSNGSGTKYYTGDVIKVADDNPSDITLYAQRRTPRVIYDSNGVNVAAPASQELTRTKAINAASALKASGFTFVNWNTQADGKGKTYNAGAQIKKRNASWSTGDLYLYANWKIVEKVDPTVTKPTAKSSLIYTNTPLQLINAGSTTGGTLYYALGENNINPPADDKWTSDASNIKANDTGDYYVWYKVTGNAAYKDVEPQCMTKITVYSADSIKYTITYNMGDAYSGSVPESQKKSYGNSITLCTNTGNLAKKSSSTTGSRVAVQIYSTNTRTVAKTLYSTPTTTTSYKAVGWATSSGGSKAYEFGGNYSKDADLNLYPAWEKSTVTEYSEVTLPAVGELTKSGYTLSGFATSSRGSKVYEPGQTIRPTKALKLYATWTRGTTTNSYTVTYNKGTSNGGTVPNKQTKQKGASVTISGNVGNLTKSDKTSSENGYSVTIKDGSSTMKTVYSTKTTKTKYSWIGWDTSTAETTARYHQGDIYRTDANLMLYPAWSGSDTVTYSKVTLPTVEKTEYSLVGYATQSGSDTVNYEAGTAIDVTGNTILYAVWKKSDTPTPAPTPKATSISSLTTSNRQMTARWTAVSGMSGYEIEVSNTILLFFKNTDTYDAKGTDTSITVSGNRGTTYTFRIRSYVTSSTGTKTYSSWSSTKSIRCN